MYKNIGIKLFIMLCVSASLATASTVSDTIFITDMPAEVETLAVKETKVETLIIAKDVDTAQTTIPVVAEAQPTTPKTFQSGTFKIQFGAFQIKENAEKLYALLQTQYGNTFYMENINSYWKVGAGNYNTSQSAKTARNTFISQGFKEVFLTH